MKRVGQMIRLNLERPGGCGKIQVEIWPEIEQAIRDISIRNYSIFQKDCILFTYFEYEGPEDGFNDRMEQMWNAPRMQEWLATMQLPLEGQPSSGAWWTDMEMILHQD